MKYSTRRGTKFAAGGRTSLWQYSDWPPGGGEERTATSYESLHLSKYFSSFFTLQLNAFERPIDSFISSRPLFIVIHSVG